MSTGTNNGVIGTITMESRQIRRTRLGSLNFIGKKPLELSVVEDAFGFIGQNRKGNRGERVLFCAENGETKFGVVRAL